MREGFKVSPAKDGQWSHLTKMGKRDVEVSVEVVPAHNGELNRVVQVPRRAFPELIAE